MRFGDSLIPAIRSHQDPGNQPQQIRMTHGNQGINGFFTLVAPLIQHEFSTMEAWVDLRRQKSWLGIIDNFESLRCEVDVNYPTENQHGNGTSTIFEEGVHLQNSSFMVVFSIDMLVFWLGIFLF